MNTKRCTCLSLFLILLSGIVAYSQDTEESTEHAIVLIKELVSDFPAAEWSDLAGGKIYPDLKHYQGSVRPGVKKGKVRYAEASPYKGQEIDGEDGFEQKTIEVEINPLADGQENAIRGTYTLALPDLKLIQLELDYDSIVDQAEEKNEADFFVEVFEPDTASPGQWKKTGEVRQLDRVKQGENYRLFELQEEGKSEKQLFVSHSYNADLSQWAGKSVKLALAAKAPASAKKALKGRWTQARLMGATFSYKIGGE